MTRTDLTPADPSPELQERGYMPRIPWTKVGLVLSIATIIFAGWYLRNRWTVNQLRADILAKYSNEVAPTSRAFLSLRNRIESWALSAKDIETPNNTSKKTFSIENLRTEKTIYFRSKRTDIEQLHDIKPAALRMRSDAATRCLGIAPTSLRSFYERDRSWEPQWLEQTQLSDNHMQLRVHEAELEHLKSSDLPVVSQLTQHSWFLLALDDNDHLDFHAWNLSTQEKVLEARTEKQGRFITARTSRKLRPPKLSQELQAAQSNSANECAAATKLRHIIERSHQTSN